MLNISSCTDKKKTYVGRVFSKETLVLTKPGLNAN